MSLASLAPAVARTSRGSSDDPAWARPALVALLAVTALLYVWGLAASQWANAFYSAAVQAGAHSWKAFFFGSSDAANLITVDKTPLALWPMDLSARLFGVNSWSILVPQALMGVATVALLHASVRRSLRPLGPRVAAGGALLAGTALAATPVAALMFRYDNPDALLVLLLTAGAYALLRAQERASTGWLVVAGSCVGLGFLAKMLQAFLVLPAFGLVYLIMAPAPLRRRLWQLAVATAALIVSAGWWVAIVAAVPAGSRPYIGGSQHNSVLELAFGYNGIGRLNGDETGGLGNTNQDAGWTRMFGAELGGQIAWLLPAALLLLAAGVWTITAGHVASPRAGRRPGPRTDGRLAAFFAWGGWLLVTDAVFSLMQGIFHGYYTVALAPPIAALVGIGGAVLWSRRRNPVAIGALAVVVALTGWWSYRLLGRTPDFAPWLHLPVLFSGLIAAAALLTGGLLGRTAGDAGPTEPGRIRSDDGPTPDPPTDATSDRPRELPGNSRSGRASTRSGHPSSGRTLGKRTFAGRTVIAGLVVAVVVSLAGPVAYAVETVATAHRGAIPSAGPAGMGGPGGMRGPGGPRGTRNGPPNGPRGGTGGWNRRGGMGGGPGALLDTSTPSTAVTALLRQNAGRYTWVAATVGSNGAAGYQLATGDPVMALGGFNGTDPAPTLARFQQYVRERKVHYFITTSNPMGARGGSGSDDAQQIAAWVAKTYTAKTVDGTTVYDLG